MNNSSLYKNVKKLSQEYKSSKPERPFVYSFVIHKGGTGKSTLTGLCSALCSAEDLKVLVVDLDHSKNITHSLTAGIPDIDLDNFGNVYSLLKDDELTFQKTVSINNNLDLLPGSYSSNELDAETMVLYRLDEAINKHYQAYDIIFIDTHADFGLRSQSALAASNAFAAPVELSDYSALNIGALLNDYNAIKRRINKYLKFHGFIVNRVDQFNSSLGRKEPKKLSQRQMYQDIQKFCENYEKTSGASLKIIGMLGNRNPVGAFSSGINLPRLEKDENAYLEALEVVEGILTLMVHGE